MPTFKKHSTIGGLNILRKEGEKIIINRGEMIIEVVEIHGKYVKLTFKASKEIDIQREEIVTAMQGGKP